MIITAGKGTTEHARALRAEILGAVIAVAGVPLHDHVIVGIGAALVAITAAAYAFARSLPKAAAVRRPDGDITQHTRRV